MGTDDRSAKVMPNKYPKRAGESFRAPVWQPGGTDLDGKWKRCEYNPWMMSAWPMRVRRMSVRLQGS